MIMYKGKEITNKELQAAYGVLHGLSEALKKASGITGYKEDCEAIAMALDLGAAALWTTMMENDEIKSP